MQCGSVTRGEVSITQECMAYTVPERLGSNCPDMVKVFTQEVGNKYGKTQLGKQSEILFFRC